MTRWASDAKQLHQENRVVRASEESRRSIAGRVFTLSRRDFFSASVLVAGALFLPRDLFAKTQATTLPPEGALAAAKSPLIYVSPLLRDGGESACHAEVWFVVDGTDLLVVTAPDRWRAAAIGKGHGVARIWIGDHGVWTSAGEKFRAAPSFVARAEIDSDPAAHARALSSFGAKYSAEWPKWGPRFKRGLASGKRVLIRYSAES